MSTTLDIAALIGRARVHNQSDDYSPPADLPEIDWNEGQREAIRSIVTWRSNPTAPRVFKLTGPAGSGKTTVLQAVRHCLHGTRTAWSAMTGKAASRMKEASGVNAKTLHSSLYNPPREVDNRVDQKIDLEFDSIRRNDGRCLLVIDEASMISPKIRADIERSSYDKILVVGDPYQIPPVLSKKEEEAQGSDYSVFTDVDGPHLTEVMRTSGAVLRAATFVREQQRIPEERDVDGSTLYEYRVASDGNIALREAVAAWMSDSEGHALITWRNEMRMLANMTIRSQLGKTNILPEVGEPLVVRRNVYGVELMNGDVVELVKWYEEGPTLCGITTRHASVRTQFGKTVSLLVPTVNFSGVLPYVGLWEWKKALEKEKVDDPIPLTWGYCLTGHLSQGSEYRRVTTFLAGDLTNPHFRKQTQLPTGEMMPFSMRFLYTALARAKQHTSLIVSR